MDKLIYLLESFNTDNEIGDPIRKLNKNPRFAEKLEIGQREFYQATAIGLKPEIKFSIWAFEYNNEMFLEYENRNYKIIKTYERKEDEKIELTCTTTTNKEVMAYGSTKSN